MMSSSSRVNRRITDLDEVNGDYWEMESWDYIEDGELGQGCTEVGITFYELKKRKNPDINDGKFEKIHKGYAKIPMSALKYIIGVSD